MRVLAITFLQPFWKSGWLVIVSIWLDCRHYLEELIDAAKIDGAASGGNFTTV